MNNERLDVARTLLGKHVRFADEGTAGRVYLVKAVWKNGLIEVEGWAGRFDPYLFVVGAPSTIPPTRGTR